MRSLVAFVRTHPGTNDVPAVQYYRSWLPLNALRRMSDKFAVDIYTQQQFLQMYQEVGMRVEDGVRGYDLYQVARMYHDEGIGVDDLVEYVSEQGGKIIFDTDDDLTGEYRMFGGETGFEKSIASYDMVTVSTPYLAEQIKKYTRAPVAILPNHMDAQWFAEISTRANRLYHGLTIGFIGTPTHENDWGYPVDALLKLRRQFPITILAAGFVPPPLKEIDDLKTFAPVPYAEYPGLMRQFDIVLCSLDKDDRFNYSKSAIKALEAMASRRGTSAGVAGAVPVCTDMPVYNRVVKHGRTGLLVDNNQWYEALKRLVANDQYRLKLAKEGHKWVKRNRDIRTGYKLWEQAYEQI